MSETYYVEGDWNAICDECGFQFKASQLRLRWDGARVCTRDYETRHPQELIRVPKEESKLPWTRPRLVDVFVTVTRDTTIGTQEHSVPTGTFTDNNGTL